MNRRYSTPLIIGSVLLLVGAGTVLGEQPQKYTICHAAGLADVPANWITLELPYPAVFGPAGHFNEDGTPAAGHEQDYMGPCASPSPSPSPSVSPSPSPSISPSPSASPSPSPSISPSPTPTREPRPDPTPTPAPTPTPIPSPTPTIGASPVPSQAPVPTLPATDTDG